MSFESILEQQRRYHEERERLMDTMTKEMLRKKATVILSCKSSFFHSICLASRTNQFGTYGQIIVRCKSILFMGENDVLDFSPLSFLAVFRNIESIERYV